MNVNKVYLGDCLEIMKQIPDNCIDAIITDPPYEIGFMNKKWDNTGIANNVEMWKECLRIIKSGGHLLSFGGTRTYHRMASAIEDAGFEVRDMIEWVYGSGFPKSLNIGKAVDKFQGKEVTTTYKPNYKNDKYGNGLGVGITDNTPLDNEWNGWGTALKPAHEPICMARKPIAEKNIAENVLKYGTGGINIDDCRVGTDDKLQPSTSTKMKYGGNSFNESSTTNNPDWEQHANGRFPANLIHDGSEEVLAIFPNTKGDTRISKPTYDKGVWGNMKSVESNALYNDSGSASRYFYCAKASKAERNEGLDEFEDIKGSNGNKWTDQDYRRGDDNPTTKRKNIHPTVKPLELMKYLCRLVTPKNGVVLDPFLGSGTTVVAAIQEGFNYIGIEKEPEYFEIAEARIEYAKNNNEKIEIPFDK